MNASYIHNRWPLAKQGVPFILIGLILTGLFFYLGVFVLTGVFGLLSLFAIYFFRDPERHTTAPAHAVLAPADGRVVQVTYLEDSENPLAAPAVKISIFMTIFNVHVNRIPLAGRIQKIAYHPGRFLSANFDKASEQNERAEITLQTEDSHKIVFVQIAGLIARRIACWVQEGDSVEAGQRFGLIRFGSRLDVYLPKDSQVSVQIKQWVHAGESIIGYF